MLRTSTFAYKQQGTINRVTKYGQVVIQQTPNTYCVSCRKGDREAIVTAFVLSNIRF